jgi:hypothetical protein
MRIHYSNTSHWQSVSWCYIYGTVSHKMMDVLWCIDHYEWFPTRCNFFCNFLQAVHSRCVLINVHFINPIIHRTMYNQWLPVSTCHLTQAIFRPNLFKTKVKLYVLQDTRSRTFTAINTICIDMSVSTSVISTLWKNTLCHTCMNSLNL